MIIIKTKVLLKKFDGSNAESAEGKEVLLSTILGNVLAEHSDNPSMAWDLGKKFATQKTVDLSAEDIVFLKAQIKKCVWLGALFAGQIIELLEKKSKEDDEAEEEKPVSSKDKKPKK